MRRQVAVVLASAAWCALAIGLLVVALGPLTFSPIGLSISGPARLVVLAAALGASAALLRVPRLLIHDLAASRIPSVATAMVTAALLGGALVDAGAMSVGGADSAGYLAQATRWRHGAVATPAPLQIPHLAEPTWRQSGLGFRPGAGGSTIVPSYPPGLPWLQAAALQVGGEAAAVRAVPLLAALLALLGAYLMARPHGGDAGATLVVAALASLPTFLFQALQPMSDVPALAAWLLALALAQRPRAAAGIGSAVATCLATLIRPNLAPLVLAVLWQAASTASSSSARHRTLAGVGVAAVAALALVAAVQATLYGSPVLSGYGRTSELFSLSHVWTNLVLYPRWLIESVSAPGLALLVTGATMLVYDSVRHRALRPLVLMAATTVALYLVYVPFDSWTYLRFILIALAVLPVGVARLLARAPGPWRFPLVCVLLLIVVNANLQRAQALGVFEVRAREQRYKTAGEFVRDRMPSSTVIVAAQHSTSAPYYSGRPMLRADLVDAAALALITSWATRQDRPLAFVLDTAEVDDLRGRLGGDGVTAFDWPPRAEIGRPVATRIWLDTDRSTYRAGGTIPTARLVVPR